VSTAVPNAEVAAGRLPRGRHGLSRAEVADTQRKRILLALAETMAAKGYVATSVADVIKAAGVSRETFYQQFSSKQDAFMAAFDAAGELAVHTLVDARGDLDDGSTDQAVERFRRGLRTYLTNLVAQPAFARMFLVEVYAAGPEALVRRAAFQARVVDAMVDDLGFGEDRRFACELMVAATAAMVTPMLVAGDLEAIANLETPIVAAMARLTA